MKKSIGVLLALLASTAIVSAADLPSTSDPAFSPIAPAAPLFTWTGGYAGINFGYGFGDFNEQAAPITGSADGIIGGFQAGYNYQFGQMVAGVEADWQLSDMNSPVTGGGNASIDNFGTVRARFGVAADRFMPYLTGGYAFANGTISVPGAKSEEFHHGWVIGAGVEYAWTDNITTKVEGLWVNFNESNYNTVGVRAGNESAILRTGLNFKF